MHTHEGGGSAKCIRPCKNINISLTLGHVLPRHSRSQSYRYIVDHVFTMLSDEIVSPFAACENLIKATLNSLTYLHR
jgi:hypothetical protein